MHADYGGVVPELASRDHIRRVLPLTRETLAEAGLQTSDIGGIAYTRGPGLAGALLGDPALWRDIAEANSIDDPFNLVPGMRLMIPPRPV